MSSSGLIYAVIVGAWAAYLVPMWLRRQDELNEARPTERFSTAIRLLAGRSGLERRASRALGDNDPTTTSDSDHSGDANHGAGAVASDPRNGGTDTAGTADGMSPPSAGPALSAAAIAGASAAGDRRARLLARRRRMVTVLFLAFALGAITAAVAGVDFLWAPALPALLLTLYIGHLRRLERQRYEVKLDRVRAAQAAQRVREREQVRLAATVALVPPVEALAPEPEQDRPELRVATAPPEPRGARQALVEATDHQEWVDGLRERAAAGPDSWEPVPVPLPTYVTAPVAPRVSRGLDLGAPGTWSSGRPVEPVHTPLFDQYETPLPSAPQSDEHYATRPRAANE
ncbi:hypothetical protein OG500_22550 [Kitasatospora sp. NBC_01250]|uniref:divisome protein SepX/GlpR n=1 Tax=unclassified Kitasatospora TaxID=2633591 RepID=UPI002E0E2ECB|nr:MULTISPECIES: gephyrin-like molybdotransferase receptor GlpR [unclassified Kitasatospora]WSJ68822.1 hypothetical protein OG294_23395 [Kitasatospora sp. NBC_01302]